MSQGEPIPLPVARGIAGALVDLLAPACARIEVAGSIRRRKPFVGDIEIVAIPRLEPMTGGMFEEVVGHRDLLATRVDALLVDGTLARRQVEVHRKDGRVDIQERMGAKFKALVFRELPVDLFSASDENWAGQLALRTGPWDWNKRLVIECRRFFRRVSESGMVLDVKGQPVETPTEASWFAALGQPWVEPWDRSVERVRIGRPS